MTTTPEQLQAWREEFEKIPTKGEFGFEILGSLYAREGEYRNRALADEFKGYLRRCQETDQAIKDARKQALEDVYNLCEAVEIDTDTTSGKRAAAKCVNEIFKLRELLK